MRVSTNSDRSSALKLWIDEEHYRPRFTNEDKCPPDCVDCTSLHLTTAFEPRAVFESGMKQFRRFLQTCLNVSENPDGLRVVFVLDRSALEGGFGASISPGEIILRGRTERDLVNGIHYLEREMVDRRGPWLPLGTISRNPSLRTRITEGIFIPGRQTVESLGDLSEEYLGLMGHFGATGLKLNCRITDVWKSEILPELNTPDVEHAWSMLRHHATRLATYGLDLFLIVSASTFPGSHEVFQKYPEIRGAREEVFLEELSGADRTVLCTSHPMVLSAYQEVIGNIARFVPEIAGIIVLVGGEGFRHCFTRPHVLSGQTTNCPRCQGQDPHAHVAGLVNTLCAGLKHQGDDKRLLAWPYSAFIWSGDDATDSRWISLLDPGVEVLSNFDCGDTDATTDAGAFLYDYNIKLIEPSTRFAAQAAACRNKGIPILAKTETNTTPDTFFVPYLPVHFRWHERFTAIREAGAAGLMGQWRFYGMNGSLPEELQYHAVWNPDRCTEQLLHTAARRDFGLDAKSADRMVEGWRALSAAWDLFPYSAMTSGEREAYMRGPWYLGPAHPLIFNEQSPYKLGAGFFRRRGDLAESLSADKLGQLPGKPRYVCNLLFCLPFGVDAYLEQARKCRDAWDEGLACLEQALGAERTERAILEMNVCHTISIHLHTLVNTADFLKNRDRMWQDKVSREEFESILQDMQAVLTREIHNARRALPIVQADPRIGFGHTYGEVYDASMIEEKIQQCEFVRDNELPRIGSVVRFHVWLRYP